MAKPTSIRFYLRNDNDRAVRWRERIAQWLGQHAPSIRINSDTAADLTIILGGDGTILQAAREHVLDQTLTFGMNLGTVGFLASVRNETHFLDALSSVLQGNYQSDQRMMAEALVHRAGKEISRTTVLNEVYVQNPLGMVRLNVLMNDNLIQQVHGTGILVATPTGSTGYNLSAHGPIIDPTLQCLIITEILDHNIPTPSIVVPATDAVMIRIEDTRKEVTLACDGQPILTLEPKDEIIVHTSEHTITLAQVQEHYFYQSLHEKFSIS